MSYKLASHNVHANPKGAVFRLGLSAPGTMLLAGPSDLGLADPGHGAAISLTQITTTFLKTEPNFDRVVAGLLLLTLVDEIGDAFITAHEQIGFPQDADEKPEPANATQGEPN